MAFPFYVYNIAHLAAGRKKKIAVASFILDIDFKCAAKKRRWYIVASAWQTALKRPKEAPKEDKNGKRAKMQCKPIRQYD